MTLYLLFERLDTGRVICQQSQGNAFFSITDAVADILLGYLDGKAVASLRQRTLRPEKNLARLRGRSDALRARAPRAVDGHCLEGAGSTGLYR
jgi:hypothetical protein